MVGLMQGKTRRSSAYHWLLRFFAVFALCFALLMCKSNAAWDYVTLTVDVDAELVYNNSVGSDWRNRYCVIYNGKTYSCASGESVEIFYKLGAQLEIYTYICEYDDANSDVGSYSQNTSFSKSDICDGNSCGWIHTVYVREDAGRYTGNTAQWDVTYTFYVVPSPTPTPKPYVLPEKVRPTGTPEPTNTPEATPDEAVSETSAPNFRVWICGLVFLALFFGGIWLDNANLTGKLPKTKKPEKKETGELHELPNSFRLAGYDEDKKTLFVVHIDDDEVFAVFNVSRKEYDRLVWARERYYKRMLKRHKSNAVGRTDQ